MGQSSKEYWENYYAEHRDPGPPSPFASFVTPFLRDEKTLVELGCGNGRDSRHFAGMGLKVVSVDQCSQELGYLSDRYADSPNLRFLSGDMADLPALGPVDFVYSRFSLHSVDRATEQRVFSWVGENLAAGGLFFIEVRSINDELYGQGEKVGEHEYRTDHYRRFVDKSEIEALASHHRLRILYSLEDQGLAVYKEEDPAVIRLVLQK